MEVEMKGMKEYEYKMEFVKMIDEKGKLKKGEKVFVGRDLRK